jgi:flagellar protein FlaG
MASDSYNVASISPTVVPTLQPTGSLIQRSVVQGQAAGEASFTQTPFAGQFTTHASGNGDQTQSASPDQVTKAVDRLNEMMQYGKQQLTFQVDDESGRMVIRVMDAQTKDIIRQIPNEETLRFAQYVDGLVGMIFSKNA